MPMQPPPGFEEAFDATCPTCGERVGDHNPEQHHEHLIVFMADPSRTVDEIIEYSAGVVASFAHCFHIGLPPWAIENIIGMQYGDFAEALRRRKASGG